MKFNRTLNLILDLPNKLFLIYLNECGQGTFARVWTAIFATGIFTMISGKFGILSLNGSPETSFCSISLTVAVWFLSFGFITGLTLRWAKNEDAGHRILLAFGSIFSSLLMISISCIVLWIHNR